ncbi:MAG: prephenate dehydratase domain-containing protein [Sphingomonadaceae bacterium]
MQNYPGPAQTLVDSMRAEARAAPDLAVAFQGAPGAYSHQAVVESIADALPLPCYSFEETIDAVIDGVAARAVIPVENSLHGRVADVHFLLPESGLYITGEHYVKVEHCLLGVPGAKLSDVREALSHAQALGQCRHRLKEMRIRAVGFVDTSAAAAHVMEKGDPTVAAIASKLAGELFGCESLVTGLQDASHNRTRFLILSRLPGTRPVDVPVKTTLAFETKNIPAALYKALGGFATNGLNLTRLESHLRGGAFTAAEFLIDVIGAPEDPPVARALEELAFHSRWVRVLGVYPKAEIGNEAD